MKEDLAEAGAQHVRDVADSNRALIEKALRMRCLAYLTHVKSQLLMQTIFDIGESKKEVMSLARRLSSTVAELEQQQGIISQKNIELELKNQELEEIRAQLAEADRRKDNFLASLGHELRNALAPTQNMLQIYRIQGYLPVSQVQKVMGIVERQRSHLTRLADDLSDVARITQGKLEIRKQTVDLAGVISDAIGIAKPLIELRKHQLLLFLGEDSLKVDADPVRLVQVVANLLLNAAKYTEPRGQIILKVERAPDELVLSVSDTGVGIPSDLLPHVFETFLRGRGQLEHSVGGIGIGLALARSLVEMHGGSIQASSPGPGQGSQFTVRLPILAERRGETVSAQKDGLKFVRRRILVVENDPDNAESFAFLLQAMGHEVNVVTDGVTALRVVEQTEPQVVFLDIGLPGMDGYEVARHLRERYRRKVVLIALTGFTEGGGPLSPSEPSFDHYLLKPVELSVLEKILSSCMPR